MGGLNLKSPKSTKIDISKFSLGVGTAVHPKQGRKNI